MHTTDVVRKISLHQLPFEVNQFQYLDKRNESPYPMKKFLRIGNSIWQDDDQGEEGLPDTCDPIGLTCAEYFRSRRRSQATAAKPGSGLAGFEFLPSTNHSARSGFELIRLHWPFARQRYDSIDIYSLVNSTIKDVQLKSQTLELDNNQPQSTTFIKNSL